MCCVSMMLFRSTKFDSVFQSKQTSPQHKHKTVPDKSQMKKVVTIEAMHYDITIAANKKNM